MSRFIELALQTMVQTSDLNERKALAKVIRLHLNNQLKVLIPSSTTDKTPSESVSIPKPDWSLFTSKEWSATCKGQKIQAIKWVRERLNLSFHDAKKFVELYGHPNVNPKNYNLT